MNGPGNEEEDMALSAGDAREGDELERVMSLIDDRHRFEHALSTVDLAVLGCSMSY